MGLHTILKAMNIPAGVVKAIWKQPSLAPRGATLNPPPNSGWRTLTQVANNYTAHVLLSVFPPHPNFPRLPCEPVPFLTLHLLFPKVEYSRMGVATSTPS